MRCSKCGIENPVGKKFCGDCGAALANLCLQCGADNPAGKRFCGECGTALGAAAAKKSNDTPVRVADTPALENIEGERKTVTALFADIKGSTQLEQDLDPEEARAIVDPALKLMMDEVHRYDGYIVQSTGDGIFALFGAPLAHEDHPQRALYAALRMQEQLRGYSSKLVAEGGTPLEARVGVNTGEVVVRPILTGAGHIEYTPIGHTANLASRMQTVAPTGSIAIAGNTQKLVEGYFELKSLGPTRVKGVTEPVNIYQVIGLGRLRTRLQRSAGRGLTKFVGREQEILAMKRAAEQAKAGRGQVVAAIAEAGVGKSRLMFEFKATSTAGWMVLEVFSVSHGKASAYLPLLDLLHTYFKIASDDNTRARREKVTGRVLALDRTLEDALPYLFALLEVIEGEDPIAQMDAQLKKRRTLDAIKRILLRESLNQTLMVIFEDLHWIDEETQAFLNLLTDSIANAKILLLVNYRPEYSHPWNSRTYYTQLRLDPLGKESADEMLHSLLGDNAELAPLKRIIIERTEGNPFFMEETVQALLDESALVRDGGMVKLTKPIAELKIPPTVQGILAARIDRLALDHKDLVQTLAVIGLEFRLGLVRKVAAKSGPELEPMISHLQLSEFIYEQPAVGDLQYTFKHALTHEVAYNSVLNERRRLLHERIGAALESVYAEQLDSHLSELARHYSRSANPTKAIEYLGRAGRQAMQRCNYPEAITDARTGLALLKHLPSGSPHASAELPLQVLLGVSLMASRGWAFPEVEVALNRAKSLCEQIGEVPQLAPVLWGIWGFYGVRGEFQTALETARQLLAIAEGSNDRVLLTVARYTLAASLFWLGELQQAQKYFEQIEEGFELEQHHSLTALFGFDCGIVGRGYVAYPWLLGYPDRAKTKTAQSVAMAEEVSHPESMAWALLGRAMLHQFCGNIAQTLATSEEVIKYSNQHGLIMQSAIAGMVKAWGIAADGHAELGITMLRQGLEALRAPGIVFMESTFRVLLADAYLRAGKPEEGLLSLDNELTTSRSEEKNFEAELARLRGAMLLERAMLSGSDLSDEAAECFRQAVEIARAQGAKAWELRATMSLARLLRHTDRRDEARAMLADIYGWFTEGFDTPDLIDAKALLDELN